MEACWQRRDRIPDLLILEAVKKDGQTVQPKKVLRIAKEHYQPFIKANNAAMQVLEQKPCLQKKVSELVKELVKLNLKPSEDFIVVFGYQWLLMWEKAQAKKAVDYQKIKSAPGEDEAEEQDDVDDDEDLLNT